MKFSLLASAAAALCATGAAASDACSTRAIVAKADVAVSDGTGFAIESYYASPEQAAIRHIRDDGATVIAAEGPFGWAMTAEKAELGPDFFSLFALGHQYHALLLDFDAIMPPTDGLSGARRAYPYGGVAERLVSEDAARPAGMRFEFPDAPPIVSVFSDWRDVDGTWLPFAIEIDDGSNVFSYQYTSVEIEDRAPRWYAEAVPAPAIDAVEVYRLHRDLMAAHCLGDADMIADLSAPSTVIASRGELFEASREATREQFRTLFEALDYTSYRDLKPPVIEVSESGDLAFAAVNVGVAATARESGPSIDDEWAWFMIARKVDGVWRSAGNASNRRPPG